MFRFKPYFFHPNKKIIFSTEAIKTFRLNFYVQYAPSLSTNTSSAIFTPLIIFTGAILYRVFFTRYLILLFCFLLILIIFFSVVSELYFDHMTDVNYQ